MTKPQVDWKIMPSALVLHGSFNCYCFLLVFGPKYQSQLCMRTNLHMNEIQVHRSKS